VNQHEQMNVVVGLRALGVSRDDVVSMSHDFESDKMCWDGFKAWVSNGSLLHEKATMRQSSSRDIWSGNLCSPEIPATS
jgi:hypothetical protein